MKKLTGRTNELIINMFRRMDKFPQDKRRGDFFDYDKSILKRGIRWRIGMQGEKTACFLPYL